MRYENDDERFRAKIQREGDCWVWTGYISTGVPTFNCGGAEIPARQYAYETEFLTTVPAGKILAQTCGTTECVNPDHLEVTTKGKLLNRVKKQNRTLVGGAA